MSSSEARGFQGALDPDCLHWPPFLCPNFLGGLELFVDFTVPHLAHLWNGILVS